MWLTEFFANLFVRHRWLVTFVVAALTALATAGHLGSTFEKRIGESGAGVRNQERRELLNELRDQFDMGLTECLVIVDGDDLFTICLDSLSHCCRREMPSNLNMRRPGIKSCKTHWHWASLSQRTPPRR